MGAGDDLSGIGRVFLVVDDTDGGFPLGVSVSGYWDRLSDTDEPQVLDELLPGGTVKDAIAWGQDRTTDVVIRSDSPDIGVRVGAYFWAGVGPPQHGLEPWSRREDLP